MIHDLYIILGVKPDASVDEIRAAYRVLARRYHPDLNPGDPHAVQQMQAINRAFDILNAPDRRREYDLRRSIDTVASTVHPKAGRSQPDRAPADRGARPYYRGNNWGLHNGATTPPEYIVRATPIGFNLVVTPANDHPEREVTVQSDAPFSVCMRVIRSPWLASSADTVVVPARGSASLTVGIDAEASADLRGWRDGGVSFDTDDPRVYCPDVRITGIFLAAAPATAATPSPPVSSAGAANDVSSPAASASRPGRLRRLFRR